MIKLIFGLLTISGGGDHHGVVEREPPDSAFFKEVAPRAEEWAGAVVGNDLDALTALAVEDYRAEVAIDLKRPESTLWQTLLAPKKSVRAELLRQKGQIAIFRYHIAGHAYAAVCHHSEPQPKWPTRYQQLMRLSHRDDVFCTNWIREDDHQWYISYGFGYQDDDSDPK